jgi:hypothetical protein
MRVRFGGIAGSSFPPTVGGSEPRLPFLKDEQDGSGRRPRHESRSGPSRDGLCRFRTSGRVAFRGRFDGVLFAFSRMNESPVLRGFARGRRFF